MPQGKTNLVNQNICKLQKEGYLKNKMLSCKEDVSTKLTKKAYSMVYPLLALEVKVILVGYSEKNKREEKLKLLTKLENLENDISKISEQEILINTNIENTAEYPLLDDVLEIYNITKQGIKLWKTKETIITLENVLENIFILSNDLASYFEIRHNNLINQNIVKLQKEKFLPDHVRKIKHMVKIGSDACRPQTIYALTRIQTETVIMDFAGPKAREKKFMILQRLHLIEADVIRGAYEDAKSKALNWDGVSMLKEHGFKCSIEGDVATKKDIANFLKIPESTLSNFLRKYKIKPTKIELEKIRNAGYKANRLNGYELDKVVKIAFWIDSPKGVNLKGKLLEKIGLTKLTQPRKEIEWREALSIVFKDFGFYTNYPIGKYRVDFFVEKLSLVLECDTEDHIYGYDKEKEKIRENVITKYYAMVRFNSYTPLEELVNGILKVKPNEVIKLYQIINIIEN